jgi:hypothetical protein
MTSSAEDCWKLSAECGRWAAECRDSAARIAFRQMVQRHGHGLPSARSSHLRQMSGSSRQAVKVPSRFQQRTPPHHLWCSPRLKSTTWGGTTTRAERIQRKYPISRVNSNGYPCRHRHASLCDKNSQQLRQLGDAGGDAPGLVAGEQLRRRASGLETARTIACLRRAKKC